MNTLMCGKRRVGTMGAMNHDELPGDADRRRPNDAPVGAR
jgi:hypothetical protein